MLMAKSAAVAEASGSRTFEKKEPPPARGQVWKSKDGARTVSVYALSDDGYVTLSVDDGKGKGSAIIREFWQLLEGYTCVQDVHRAEG